MSDRYGELSENLLKVRERIKVAAERAGRDESEISLIVVTKTFPVSDAEILYDLGERNFGENRDDEGAAKQVLLPDVTWHFQGQIQSRKIKSIASWASVIHSLDDLRHAEKFAATPRVSELSFFVQVSLEEGAEHRGGVPTAQLATFLQQLSALPAIHLRGLMVVPPLSMEPAHAFSQLRELGESHGFSEYSMGMSGDFEAAIAAGATHIRVGSSILGSRTYPA